MTFVPILLAGLVLSPQGQPRLPGASLSGKQLDFFRQVISTPTGANGYEEYTEVAAIIKESNFGQYLALENMTISDFPQPYTEDKDGTRTFIPIPEGLSIHSTTLEVRQACIRRFGHLLEVIRRGNAKPVFQPRTQIGIDTLLPELSQFKNVTKLLLMKSQVEFSAGSSGSATDALCEALRFARNVGEGSMIHMLVSIANTSIALSGFENGLGRLSLQDANNVIKVIGGILARPALSATAFQTEFQLNSEYARNVVERPELARGGDLEKTAELIGKLDSRMKAPLIERIDKYCKFKQDQLAKLLAKPEKDWHLWQDVPLSVSTDEKDQVDGIASTLVNLHTASYAQCLAAQAKSRAQLRIMRASARVIAFKWTKGKLPLKLEVAMPAAEIEDPASGGKLTYERPAPGVFVIHSKGFGDLGPIGIVYRRTGPGQLPVDDSVPPPE